MPEPTVLISFNSEQGSTNQELATLTNLEFRLAGDGKNNVAFFIAGKLLPKRVTVHP